MCKLEDELYEKMKKFSNILGDYSFRVKQLENRVDQLEVALRDNHRCESCFAVCKEKGYTGIKGI